jgi:hypothetical protein
VARACKLFGALALAVGLVIAITCVLRIAGDEDYRKAALIASRNPGNVLYEAEFKGAQVVRGFQVMGVVAGVLFSLNGLTMFLLGSVAGRADRR